MSAPQPRTESRSLVRELGAFLTAVLVGSLSGLTVQMLLGGWLGTPTAGSVAIAVGTTFTGATHARLVHGQPVMRLLPRIAVAAPLAYVVMQAIHGLLGS